MKDGAEEMQLKVSVHSFLEMVAKTWHFLVLIVGFVWMVSQWKEAQDDHLKRIDEQIQVQQEKLNVEDEKLDWLIRHVQNPNEAIPQFFKAPKSHTHSLYVRPMLSREKPPEDAQIPPLAR